MCFLREMAKWPKVSDTATLITCIMFMLKLCVCLSVLQHISHLTGEIVQINQWFIMLAAFASPSMCYFDIWWYTVAFYRVYKRTCAIMAWAKSVGGFLFFFCPKTVHFLVCEPLPDNILFFISAAHLNFSSSGSAETWSMRPFGTCSVFCRILYFCWIST